MNQDAWSFKIATSFEGFGNRRETVLELVVAEFGFDFDLSTFLDDFK